MARCGSSWRKSITVTGKLPNGYGADFSRTLSPVSTVNITANVVGHNSAAEDSLRNALLSREGSIRNALGLEEAHLKADERAALFWRLNRAKEALERTQAINRAWTGRAGGPWPLSKGDRLWDFDGRCAPKNGAGKRQFFWGDVIEQTQFGSIVCPTQAQRNQRVKDRAQILALFVDAVHDLRCAEYWLWRIVLYRQAREAWLKTPQGQAAQDLQAGGGGGGGGGLGPFIPATYGVPKSVPKGPGAFKSPFVIPPPEPPGGFGVPQPPPGPPLPPPPAGPDAATEGPTRTSGTRTAKKGSGVSTVVVVGGAAIGLALLLRAA